MKQIHRSKRNIFLVLLGGSTLFFVVIPIIIFYVSSIVSTFLRCQSFDTPYAFYLGIVVSVLGFIISSYAVYALYRYGQGTPAPFLPPTKLVKEGPYKYSRNPIGLGNMLYTVGLGIIIQSVCYIILAVAWYTLILVYDYFIEEKQLEKKFGEEYREYRKSTPFLIPFPKRRKLNK